MESAIPIGHRRSAAGLTDACCALTGRHRPTGADSDHAKHPSQPSPPNGTAGRASALLHYFFRLTYFRFLIFLRITRKKLRKYGREGRWFEASQANSILP